MTGAFCSEPMFELLDCVSSEGSSGLESGYCSREVGRAGGVASSPSSYCSREAGRAGGVASSTSSPASSFTTTSPGRSCSILVVLDIRE